jgi:hypothetical protein
MIGRLTLGCALVPLLWMCAAAQTMLNPDLSLIGDMRVFSHDDPGRPAEESRLNLADPGLEMVIGAYLNPYARADAVIAWEEGNNAEIEEVYATFLRGLPLEMNLRVGQYLLEFGRLNPTHPHAYPFIHRPLPHEFYFGEEGLKEMAVRASFLLPTGGLYSEAMFGVLKGDLLAGESEDAADTTSVDPGFFARLAASAATSDYGELAFGASALTAEYDPVENFRAWLGGVDVKYKWKPSRNRSLQVESELLISRREVMAASDVTSIGAYGYVDYRFRQRFNLGAIGEYAQGVFDSDRHTWRIGGFLGFAPVEETSVVRLEGDWTRPESGDGFWSLNLQLVFGLGPHQPHTF